MAYGSRRRLTSATASLAAVLAASLQAASGRVVVKHYNKSRAAELVLCGLDVTQSLISIGQAATGITAATYDCGPKEGDAVICAAAVNGVLSSIADTATFMATGASDCAVGIDLKEYCAADVAGMVASLTTLASNSLSLTRTCVRSEDHIADNSTENEENKDIGVETLGRRRLRAQPGDVQGRSAESPIVEWLREVAKEKEERVKAQLAETRGLDIADCVFDVNSATSFLARAALGIDASTSSCELRGKGSNAEACTVDLFGIIGSFADAAQFISFAVDHCALKEHVNALCAADIAALISGLSGVISASASFNLTCGIEGFTPVPLVAPLVIVP